jgi:hypothetical protein
MCEGKGNSQDEAVEDLGDDIAFYLEDKIYGIIDDTITNHKAKFVPKKEQQIQRNRSNFKFSAELFNSPELEKLLKRLKKFSALDGSQNDPVAKLVDELLGDPEESGHSPTVVGFNIPISLN